MSKLVIIVDFELHPGAAERFMPIMLQNAHASVQDEPGCLQFDVLMPDKEANNVFLYEVYENDEAFDKHLLTPHFLAFKAAVGGLVKAQTVRRYRYA